MKKSEALDWGMRALIELMSQEQEENKRAEQGEALKLLASMFILEEREESKQGYLSWRPQNCLERLLEAFKQIWVATNKKNY